jgi:outer membrane protein OmpA-like peptidoglycan-associated protein/outer membrane protein assembly factor BamB
MKKALLVLILLASPLFAAAWDVMQGNQYLTGNNDEIVPATTNLNWGVEFPGLISHPVPFEGRLFLSSIDANLYCLDMATGELLWKFPAKAPLIRSSLADGGRVVFVSGGDLYCLDAADAELLWMFRDPVNNIYIYPIISEGRVFYGTRKRFICRDLATGRKVWETTNVSLYGGSMTAFDGLVVLQSRDYRAGRFTVTALDTSTGEKVWQKEIQQDNVIATPVIYEKRVFVSARKFIYCLDVYTGREQWVQVYPYDIASDTVFASGNLFVATEAGHVLVLDPASGDVRKVLPFLPGKLPFAVVGENLFVYETATGTLFRTALNGFKTSVFFRTGVPDSGGRFAIAGGDVYLPVRNRLFAIGEKQAPLLLAAEKRTRTISGTLRDASSNAVSGTIIVASVPHAVTGDFSIDAPDLPDLTLSVIADRYLYRTIALTNGQQPLDIALEPAVKDRKFTLRNILFDFNSSDLKPSSIPVLLELKDYLELNRDVRLLIQGHTDNIGEPGFNLALSRKRAERVREFLVKNGIGEDRLATEGLGESRPVADNAAEAGRSLNRRIEFTVK